MMLKNMMSELKGVIRVRGLAVGINALSKIGDPSHLFIRQPEWFGLDNSTARRYVYRVFSNPSLVISFVGKHYPQYLREVKAVYYHLAEFQKIAPKLVELAELIVKGAETRETEILKTPRPEVEPRTEA